MFFNKPEGGWKPNTIYLVKVAWNPNNPIHSAIFYSGFLDDKGMPGTYSCLLTPNYEAGRNLIQNGTLYYFEIVRELVSSEEWSGDKRLVLPKERN